MAEHSRRQFLTYSSLATATAVTASVPVTTVTAAAAPAKAPSFQGSVVAFVRDYRSGEITVLAGEHEVTCHDPALAARLSQLADIAQS